MFQLRIRKTVLALAATLVPAALSACATGAPAAGGTAMTDGNVVAIAMASNAGEVQTSQPALQRAASQQVRDFAQQMITDHTAANEQLRALGIPPMENALSRDLASNAAATTQALSTRTGADFDRTYMEAQVAMHRWTLTSLESALIPSARNRALRTQLSRMRDVVAAHLQRGEQILSGLR